VTWLTSLLTLLGLAFAVWQLQRTRSAAEAARAAVSRLRSRIAQHDAASACSALLELLAELRNYHEIEQFERLPDRYNRLRRLLPEVISTKP